MRAVIAISMLVVVAAVLAEGDSARGRPPAAESAAAAPPSACSGKRTGRFLIAIRDENGIRRTALVNVPRVAHGNATPLPLVIAMHGAGGNGRFMEAYSGLTGVANRAGFAVVYPDAAGAFWQYSVVGEDGADDVAVVRRLLDRAEQLACVDPDRVYATGISNGAGMAARLACDMSDRLAAVAPVAGGYRKLPPCHPERPLSVLEIHGTDDASVPYAGAPPDGAGSVAGFLAQWAATDGCAAAVKRTRVAMNVLAIDRAPCAAGTRVAHLRVVGGGHAWPGTPLHLPGHETRLSAANAIWRFFSPRRRAAPFEPAAGGGQAKP